MDNNTILFAISKTGASHTPKGIPCQDYSLKWESEDGFNRIIIVCDGHGSSTYVRSDTGSRLAANITKDILVDFISNTDPMLFINHKGSVTARPSLDEITWSIQSKKPESSMTEVELMIFKQNQLFYKQVQEVKGQDSVFCELFAKIYQEWLDAIKKDCDERPFDEIEQKALGDHNIVKAYGTTLMAFVQTQYFWFSFHIGDGRIITADRSLNWSQPVPWDCNCFQNYTTSLCNTNPLLSFRYAFDGTGYFPVAVICCSDGIEDSYGDYDVAPNYLHKFYNGLLDSFLREGESISIEKLSEFLPKLSSAGSKDDMSLAGIINLNEISDGLKECELRNKRDLLNAQHLERIKKQKASEEQLNKIQKELDELKQKLEESEQKKLSILERMKKLLLQEESLRSEETKENNNISDFQKRIKSHTETLEKLFNDINDEIEKNKREDEEARIQKAELKRQFDEIERRVSERNEAEIQKWRETLVKLIENKDNTDVKGNDEVCS